MRLPIIARMGGGRVVRVMRNQQVTECIGGKTCHFRSKLERNWAVYLELLKQQNEILDWNHETITLIFPNEIKGVKQWLVDFTVEENDGSLYYQETKGLLEGPDVTRFIRASKYYPNARIDLVMQSKASGKKKAMILSRIKRIEKTTACRRVILAADIFRQIKNVVNLI